MKKRFAYLMMLLLLILALPTVSVHAQTGGGGGVQFVDTDGDGLPDEFDGCPNEAGLPENYGCPAGTTPPDSDGDTLPDVGDGCRDVAGLPEMSGCPDTDGDQVPENSDACPNEAGLSQNSGCPLGVVADLDQDGVPDREDVCYNQVGVPEVSGCPLEGALDTDGDGVFDFVDTCFSEAGDPANAGCPASVAPDSDYDTIPDAQDACPRQYGAVDNNGCLKDVDGDFIEDQFDGCPDQPGDGRNSGCPAGSVPPDSDGDAVPDIYDRCVSEAGVSGSDCPDRDGDFVSDIDDLCPDQTGDPSLQGCTSVIETSLPVNRAPLNASNLANISMVGNLRTGVTQIAVASGSPVLAIQSFNSGLMLYDLTADPISPRPFESQTGIIDLNADGSRMVDTLYDSTVSKPSFTIWDTATVNGINYIVINDEDFTNTIAISPDGTIVATGHGFYSPFGEPVPEGSAFNVHLWDANSAQQISVLNNASGVTQLAFSPDGTKLAAGTDKSTTIWDVASGQGLTTLEAAAMFTGNSLSFSPNGTQLAIGQMGGSVSVWDTASFANLYEAQIFDNGQFNQAITALAYSPDGSLLAVAGGPFVDGPPLEDFNYQVVILNAADGTPIKSIDNLSSLASSLAFSSDGTLIIFNVANEVQFWAVTQ